MKTKVIFLMLLLSSCLSKADEGMWIPMLLQKKQADMQSKGMYITAEDIYSINQTCLKDAILLFNGGCTASYISEFGLILTNFHCGHGQIQSHSSLENDYLSKGFWAKSFDEELPCEGVTVTSLVRMEDVTDAMKKGLTESMTEAERQKTLTENSKKIRDAAIAGTTYEAQISPFYNGNQYFLFINETFKDIRLVGAPPVNIGKFGGDTDNWVWPRHTGDFCLFRVYADKENKAADYNTLNKPFTPKNSLKINNKGAKDGDFTMVFGYPGRTQEYLTSFAIQLAVDVQNNIAINARTKRLDIINEGMDEDPLVRIKYSAKAAGISNGWKKWQGENRGIKRLNGIEKKQTFEKTFQAWADTAKGKKYKDLLPAMKSAYANLEPYSMQQLYFRENVLAPEVMGFSSRFFKLIDSAQKQNVSLETVSKEARKLEASAKLFFKDLDAHVDKKIFKELSVIDQVDGQDIRLISFPDKNFDKFVDEIYEKSVFTDLDRVNKMLSAFINKNYTSKDVKKLLNDPLYQYASRAYALYSQSIAPTVAKYQGQVDSLQRIYMQAQMEMQPKRQFYPDANSTLRVSYGKIEGMTPADGLQYKTFTTLKGVMEKEDSTVYDLVVEPKLKELYEKKDYGNLIKSGEEMPLAFIASNHTTGGNSGSPVLDAYGHLIGLNFDRCWEGTMSDLMYDPDQCRNISLDVRYILFVISKFANANNLIEEMNLLYRYDDWGSKTK